MSDSPHEGRLYDEDDVAEILKRASEKQSSQKIVKSGLTLGELKQIAAEAGIDPRYISDAVSEMSDSPSRPDRVLITAAARTVDEPNFWGGPLSATREVVVDGVIDDFAWEEMVAEARRTFDDTGEVREWSNSREWASNVNSARAHVTATTRDGKTKLQVFRNNPGLAAATFVPAMVVSLISMPIVFEELALSGPLSAFVILSVVIMAFATARGVTTLIARNLQWKMERLLERLQRIALLRAASRPEAHAQIQASASISERASDSRPPRTDDEWGDSTDGRESQPRRNRIR